MARMRTLRPEFWSDRKLSKLPRDVRMFFAALWNFADDYGRGRAIPRELAGFAFPYDDDISTAQIAEWLEILAEVGRIQLYEVEEERFFVVVNWEKHQSIDKPTPSRLPEPPKEEIREALANDSRSPREGVESKGGVGVSLLGVSNLGSRSWESRAPTHEGETAKSPPPATAPPDLRIAGSGEEIEVGEVSAVFRVPPPLPPPVPIGTYPAWWCTLANEGWTPAEIIEANRIAVEVRGKKPEDRGFTGYLRAMLPDIRDQDNAKRPIPAPDPEAGRREREAQKQLRAQEQREFEAEQIRSLSERQRNVN
jgi:hypothetical protein